MAECGAQCRVINQIVSRYGQLISGKEERSVSEIRQRVTPYTDFIKALRDGLIRDILPYDHAKHFGQALPKVLDYIRSLETVRLPLVFWLSFEEMDSLKAGTPMDKALLMAALLRSLESPNARVVVTKSQKAYVAFENGEEKNVVNPETCSILSGDDALKVFQDDPMAYVFNDLMYESFDDG
ncbi:MAG: hypothetical protein ACP5NX_03550 [Candidatus Bilamarchaeaceae archaeon]